jgi:hypothetical protein
MAGNLLQGLAEELGNQTPILQRFAHTRLPKAPRGSIFVGAGDSYAASLAGFYASKGRCFALDPYSLASAPGLAKGMEVFFISVSGRTASNVAAAKKVKRVAKRTTAITADRGSELANLADEVIALPMAYAPRTPGMLSFSVSLLAVLGISNGPGRCDFWKMWDWAQKDSEEVSWGRNTTYFLGNSLGYPAAIYAAAKTYELLGEKAHPELLEEFSHLELFSLRKSDVVNVFSCFDPLGASHKLSKALAEQRYESHVVPVRGSSDFERLFHAVFVSQLSVVGRAKEAGLSDPKFLSARGRLRISDCMIY